MSRAAQATKNTITLKGSTEIVTEFFGYSINSILDQRGISPPESLARVSKYGLQMLVTSDAGLQKYLQQVLTQLSEWLYAGSVQKLVLVITSLETQTVLERWNLPFTHSPRGLSGGGGKGKGKGKGETSGDDGVPHRVEEPPCSAERSTTFARPERYLRTAPPRAAVHGATRATTAIATHLRRRRGRR